MAKWDLKVNWKKTKVMKVAREGGDGGVRVGDQVIAQVEEMKYLGVITRMQEEVEGGIGSATRMIGGMSEAGSTGKERVKQRHKVESS